MTAAPNLPYISLAAFAVYNSMMIVCLFSSVLTSLLLLLVCHDDATALAAPKRTPVVATASNKNKPGSISVEQKTNKPGMTNLRFQASTNYATQPAAYHPCVADVLFEHRNKILAGTKNRVELLPAPDVRQYYLQWKVEAEKNGVVVPTVGDAILRVTTTAIQFPGLTLQTVATVGCKEVVDSENKNAAPSLQITLIDDELQASGPEPLVWVFYKLTGANNKNNRRSKSTSERTTHSTNIITAEKTDDNMVVFRSVARLVIDVSFPSLLLTLLPTSHRQAETQGSKAIQSVVERDIGPTLEALRTKYIAHLKGMERIK